MTRDPFDDLTGAMALPAAAAGLRLGLFDALPARAVELAPKLGVDAEALDVLVQALAGAGYLTVEDGVHDVSERARSWTSGQGANVLLFWHSLLGGLWHDLDKTITTGVPAADFYTWLAGQPDTLARFHALQRGLAASLAEEIAGLDVLPEDARTLLDLGGGHGLFSAALCAGRPDLRATLVDLPEALTRDPAERVTPVPGDLRDGVPWRDQDVVLLFNVVHGFAASQARRLVFEAIAALRPGGVLLLLEEPAGQDSPFTALFGLNLLHTQGGRLYTVEELGGWMSEAGGLPYHRHDLERSRTHVLLTVVRGAHPEK